MKLEKLVAAATVSLIVYALALSLFNTATSPPTKSKRLGSGGALRAHMPIAVYSDPQGNYTLSSIEWGTLEPAENKNVTCYVKNCDKTPLTLSFMTQNWNPPEASDYINLSWNYDGRAVNASEIVEIIFTISVSANVPDITDFSFDIVVAGTP